MPGPTKPAPARFLRLKDVEERTTLGRNEIYRRMKAGNFPANFKIGPQTVVWLEDDVTTWIHDQVTACAAA